MIRFDEVRGYGFIAPDGGGEDVFLHANDVYGDKYAVRPGVRVQFEVEEGDRGPKASGVRIIDRPGTRQAARPVASRAAPADDDDGMCDVLSSEEYRDELTEVLIADVPTLTGAQIAQLRLRLVRLAQHHGWVET